MHTFHHHWNLFAIISLLVNLAMLPLTKAQERILVSYGGHNETVGPLWVAADKGFFKKSGLDVSILQVRNGQVSLTALMSGDVHAFWTAVSSVLSGVSGGAKIGCVAAPFHRIAPELNVRKEIEPTAALRREILGVQSNRRGFWLQAMIGFDRLG